MKFEKNKFDTEGYSGPFKFLNEDNCKKLLEEQYIPKKNLKWQKSIHEKSKNILRVASNPILYLQNTSIVHNLQNTIKLFRVFLNLYRNEIGHPSTNIIRL